MTNIDLLIQAVRQVAEETGEPWPDCTKADFIDPDVARLADVFADAQRCAAVGNVQRTLDDLLAAAKATLSNNLHLADGDTCTLIGLKRAVEHITGEQP